MFSACCSPSCQCVVLTVFITDPLDPWLNLVIGKVVQNHSSGADSILPPKILPQPLPPPPAWEAVAQWVERVAE